MAFHVPKAPGFSQMLKDGARHFQGLDEAVYRNIKACGELAKTTKTAFGPHGMNKMVINHIEKLFVTNDAATILKELEVEHPAAKMIVIACQMCEQEVGDGTNFVLIFAGALMTLAEELLRMGLSVPEVIEGYEQACEKAIELLPNFVCSSVEDLRDVGSVAQALKTPIASKQYGNEDFLAKLLAEACVSILPPTKIQFSVDNIRVSKLPGSGVNSSCKVSGMVFMRECESDIKTIRDPKVAVYSCPFDMLNTETKGTVLIKNAKELKSFSTGEEDLIEAQIKAIVDTGVNVIVSGGKVSDLALHFANKFKLMVVRLNSKWDLRRLCKTINATALPRLTAPTPEEMGHCSIVRQDEIGDRSVVIFEHTSQEGSKVCTLVLRASTSNILDDLERAVDDGVNNYKVLTRDNKMVPGAGATEIELANQIAKFGESCPGLEQYAIKKFAQALEVVPRALAENAGLKPTEIVSKLYASHQEEGGSKMGVDIETGDVIDVVDAAILDPYLVKHWALRLATNAAVTVLRVDQIIMAKAAGGPKPPKKSGDWDKDPDE
uniref:T-complex protein 1 subunit theta n=1 Tax=Phallusia mammillata TaxID=59560 RepID=A0A6F9D859_9ASCI|nr:T-complex protein 1 subunit theta-like [Phallusia mammillata]